MNQIKTMIEDIRIKHSTSEASKKLPKTDMLSFWLDEGYKEKFLTLQKDTKCDFGKDVQEVIKVAIDLAYKSRYP
jgi:hypothetical protein